MVGMFCEPIIGHECRRAGLPSCLLCSGANEGETPSSSPLSRAIYGRQEIWPCLSPAITLRRDGPACHCLDSRVELTQDQRNEQAVPEGTSARELALPLLVVASVEPAWMGQ